MKPLEDLTFEELRDVLAADILTRLMEEGGKGFRYGVFSAMDMTLRWERAVIGKEKQTKNKKRKLYV